MSRLKQPKPQDRRYMTLVMGRLQDLTEEEIATKAGFDSPSAFYRQLYIDGYPICAKCGATHAGREHRHADEGERRARRSTNYAKELPPAKDAIRIFEQALDTLREEAWKLEGRIEFLQDERFVLMDYQSAGFMLQHRESFKHEVWKAQCERYGYDPEGDIMYLHWPRAFLHGGSSQNPAEPLTKLIGVYVLAGQPMRPLLNALHPDLDEAREDKIMEYIEGKEGLKVRIGQIAKEVRGGEVRRGRSTEELTADENFFALYIHMRRKEGLNDEEIYRSIKHWPGHREDSFAHKLTKSEFQRLADLHVETLDMRRYDASQP